MSDQQPAPLPIPVPTQETTQGASLLTSIFGDKCVVRFFLADEPELTNSKKV